MSHIRTFVTRQFARERTQTIDVQIHIHRLLHVTISTPTIASATITCGCQLAPQCRPLFTPRKWYANSVGACVSSLTYSNLCDCVAHFCRTGKRKSKHETREQRAATVFTNPSINNNNSTSATEKKQIHCMRHTHHRWQIIFLFSIINLSILSSVLWSKTIFLSLSCLNSHMKRTFFIINVRRRCTPQHTKKWSNRTAVSRIAAVH